MNSSEIYKMHFLNECLSAAKHRRDQWDEYQLPTELEPEREDKGIASLCDLGGEDYGYYKFMMDGLRKSVREAIISSVLEVAQEKGISGEVLNLGILRTKQYVTFDQAGRPRYFKPIPQGKLELIPGLFLTVKDIATAFIFIEPSIDEFLPSRLENTLLSSPGIDRIKYVMLADKGSPSPSMNWRERESETVQGYKTYSLEEFYDDTFGQKEWELFEGYLKELRECVADYCGISIVKALRLSSIRHFKLSIDVESERLSKELVLTGAQKTLLDARFTSGRGYAALTGTSDFANSFKTAEWLYKSLGDACGSTSDKPALVDLTPITASYFKAIEQYIYDYMALHTRERDKTYRKLFVGLRRRNFPPSRDYQKTTAALSVEGGYVEINEQLMSPPFKEMLSLGLLTRFFGSRDQNGGLHENCVDLLVDDAKDCGVYELVIDTLAKVTKLRNGYFHKDNLHDWNRVDEVRDTVRLAFYLLLGAYKMTPEDEIELGFDSGATLSNTYRLCDYINHRALMVDRIRPDGSRVIPLFYCEEVAEPLLAMSSDSATVYDQYGNPAYDGLHFRKLDPRMEGQDVAQVFFSLTSIPKQLSEGYLELTNPDPFQNVQSGPLKKIFDDGNFMGALEF